MATASLTIGANTGHGIREYVAAALDVLDEMGIRYEFTAMATNLEGDVATICRAVVAIHECCHALGAPRIETLLKIDDRIDVEQTLETKVRHVNELRARDRDARSCARASGA